MSGDTGEQTPGFLVDPGPQEAAPQHADEADEPVPVGYGESACTHECSRKEAELTTEDRKKQPTKCELFKDGCEGDILHEADGRQRGWAPDQIGIEPLRPMVRQMQWLGHPIHYPFPPQPSRHDGQYCHDQSTGTAPS